ncbi:preprotein translocase subunit SecG [Holospora elegans E1]|uniref:Preprotein translocase subunit SecG n=1 Tax=Holospora elegans E1 TaxID=1427503 RepID=A0A023DWS0_9PROT|nr:hypothetical protein [Holospora elegans]GAJ45791.1 preprotein translocase subunit SecG [Holospora elegans E1]
MKKNFPNILFFALSLGIIVPSQGWSGPEQADASAQPLASPAPEQPAQQAVPTAQDPAVAAPLTEAAPAPEQDKSAAGPALDSANPEAGSPKGAEGEQEAAGEGKSEEKKGSEKKKKKTKKKRKGKGKSHGKLGTAHHYPPENVINNLNARNNVDPAPSVCGSKVDNFEDSSVKNP